MLKTHTSALTTLLALLCAPSPVVADPPCWNHAYRYCCHIASGWSVPCPGLPKGVCEGLVHNGINEFKQTKVAPTTGAMTDSSFQLVGGYDCEFYPPICHGGPAPHCTWELDFVIVECSEWKGQRPGNFVRRFDERRIVC
jgi:hypothetical protein